MDNKCLQLVKGYILYNKKINLLLVLLCMDHMNTTEKAINSFKNYFITGFATLDSAFLMHLWCQLLLLATTTLNLLQLLRVNLNLSAEEFLNSIFDYNKTHITPLDYKVLVHETKAIKKNTFSAYGQDGWYISTALLHYRCHKVHMPKTRSKRTAKLVEFFLYKEIFYRSLSKKKY